MQQLKHILSTILKRIKHIWSLRLFKRLVPLVLLLIMTAVTFATCELWQPR